MKLGDLKRIFGTAIRSKRSEMGFSQMELAHRAGLNRASVSEVERGARNVSLESIEKLAGALEMSVTGLFARVGHEEASLHGEEILLVEDCEEDVELTLRAFSKANFQNTIWVVHDGAEAIEFLMAAGRYADRRDAPLPAVVLLDLNLPKLSGVEVLRWIRADDRLKHLPVVVLTDSHKYRDAVECRDLGVERYIVKPVDFRSFSDVATHLKFEWAMVNARGRRAG